MDLSNLCLFGKFDPTFMGNVSTCWPSRSSQELSSSVRGHPEEIILNLADSKVNISSIGKLMFCYSTASLYFGLLYMYRTCYTSTTSVRLKALKNPKWTFEVIAVQTRCCLNCKLSLLCPPALKSLDTRSNTQGH